MKMDFCRSPKAAKVINDWVKPKSNQHIQNLIPDSIINSDTRMILVNAVYFKGTWKKRFAAKETIKMPFYISDENKVAVQMMTQKECFPFADIKNRSIYHCFDNIFLIAFDSKENFSQKFMKKYFEFSSRTIMKLEKF